jgi:hypothetical protein
LSAVSRSGQVQNGGLSAAGRAGLFTVVVLEFSVWE